MFRHTVGYAIVAISLCSFTRASEAQEGRPSSRRPPTLSERMEQFRSDLLGESTPAQKQQSAGTNLNAPQGAKSSAGSPAVAPVASDEAAVIENPFAADRKVRAGSRFATKPEAAAAPSTSGKAPQAQKTPTARQYQTASRPTVDPQTPRSSRRVTPPEALKRSSPVVANPADDVQLDEPTSLEEKMAKMRRANAKDAGAVKRSTPTEANVPHVARAERPEVTPVDEPTEADEKPVKPTATTPRAVVRSPGENVLFSSQSALLTVEASGPRKVLIGKEAAFVFKLRNASDVAANNIAVTINIPTFAEVASAQASNGTTRSPAGADHTEPFEWKINRLEAHGRETLTLKVVPHKSLPLDLSAQWTCAPETSQTLVEVQEPKLVLGLSGPEEVLYGQSKVYKLTLANPGNGDAENVMVSLSPIGRGGEGTASHRLGTIKAGDNKSIEVELTARQAGALTIKAQAFADGGLRAEISEQVLVRRANLKVDVVGSKVKYAGTVSTYQVRVSNTGNAPADKVQVAAMLPLEAKFVSANNGGHHEAEQAKVVWSAGTLQPGADRQFEMQCTLMAPGDNRLQVVAMGERDLSGSAMAATRVEALADLKLEVRDPQGPMPVGEDAVYEVIIRNRGTKAAEAIDLVVFFSEGLEATAVQGGSHDIGHGQVLFKPIASLGAGSESIMRIHAKADRGGNHVFRAEVVCKSLKTKLAAEETTHFYGEETARVATRSASRPTPARRKKFVADEPVAETPAELQPVPAEEPAEEPVAAEN